MSEDDLRVGRALQPLLLRWCSVGVPMSWLWGTNVELRADGMKQRGFWGKASHQVAPVPQLHREAARCSLVLAFGTNLAGILV